MRAVTQLATSNRLIQQKLLTEGFLTTAAFAEKNGYTVDYVQKLCRKKKINCQKIGSDWLIKDVERRNLNHSNTKPTSKQMISILQNLLSCMDTSHQMLTRYDREDKALELAGARLIVRGWIEELKHEK